MVLVRKVEHNPKDGCDFGLWIRCSQRILVANIFEESVCYRYNHKEHPLVPGVAMPA